MNKGRLEAFSDAVIAIIITIMVLELKVPHDTNFEALQPLIPVFLSYILSFIYLGLYWNNHHHLFQAVQRVNGNVLWANLHLLFWLSLFPFVTGWAGETLFATVPVACYGFVLFCAAISYYILTQVLISHHGKNSTLAVALGSDLKGKVSVVTYAVAILLAFVAPWLACLLYTVIAIVWLIPDRRIEKALTS